MNVNYLIFYLIFYFVLYLSYLLFGYNFLSRLITNKPIELISFDTSSGNFVIKRLLQLSLITLLVSGYILANVNNLDINLYFLGLILNLTVIIFNYIKWYPFNDSLTYYFHILWSIPIFIIPLFCNFTGTYNIFYTILYVILLLLYKYAFEKYVYN